MPVDFSVVIPTCRRPQQLAVAIASVLSQTGVSIEILIVDDSDEGSAQPVVNGIGDARVRYLRNPEPTGGVPSVVRNLGWPLGRGTLVHFLDDDDIVPDGHYAAVKAAFSEHPDVGVVFGRIEPFGNAPPTQMQHEHQFFRDAARRASFCARFGSRWGFTGCMLFRRTMLVCSAAVVRRECLRTLGGFDPLIRIGEDTDFYCRAIRQFGAHYMERTVLRFHIGGPSLMHSQTAGSTWETQQLGEARKRTRARYRAEWGALEFYAIKIFSHTVLRLA
jgi:GT2 family glycosyltransferase